MEQKGGGARQMRTAKPKPNQTNEQLLRSLKGEKLAVFLDKNNFCPDNPLECASSSCRSCGECILQWLRKEAEGC